MWLHCFKNATICCIAKTSQILDFPSIFVDNPWVPFCWKRISWGLSRVLSVIQKIPWSCCVSKDHDPDAQSFVTDQKRVFRITKEECFAFSAFRDRARFNFFPLEEILFQHFVYLRLWWLTINFRKRYYIWSTISLFIYIYNTVR